LAAAGNGKALVVLFWLLSVLILAKTASAVGAVYLLWSRRYPQIGLAVCNLSFSYMLVLTNLIMPLFS